MRFKLTQLVRISSKEDSRQIVHTHFFMTTFNFNNWETNLKFFS